jgi:hypothetical protein
MANGLSSGPSRGHRNFSLSCNSSLADPGWVFDTRRLIGRSGLILNINFKISTVHTLCPRSLHTLLRLRT